MKFFTKFLPIVCLLSSLTSIGSAAQHEQKIELLDQKEEKDGKEVKGLGNQKPKEIYLDLQDYTIIDDQDDKDAQPIFDQTAKRVSISYLLTQRNVTKLTLWQTNI